MSSEHVHKSLDSIFQKDLELNVNLYQLKSKWSCKHMQGVFFSTEVFVIIVDFSLVVNWIRWANEEKFLPILRIFPCGIWTLIFLPVVTGKILPLGDIE